MSDNCISPRQILTAASLSELISANNGFAVSRVALAGYFPLIPYSCPVP